MTLPSGKTIKVRCSTWDQVEAFYTEKLRGNAVVVKMPYRPEIGERIAVALGLPDGLVFAIDGDVVKVGQDDSGRVPVALRLAGMGRGVREQLERLVAAARSVQAAPSPPPMPEASVGDDERAEVLAMEAELVRRSSLAAHDLLGVSATADLAEVRRAYLVLARRHHPDARARYRTAATRRLAAELFLGVARAFDRLREASPASTRVPGPAFASRAAWLTHLEPEASGVVAVPVVSESSSPYSEIQLESGPLGVPASGPIDVPTGVASAASGPVDVPTAAPFVPSAPVSQPAAPITAAAAAVPPVVAPPHQAATSSAPVAPPGRAASRPPPIPPPGPRAATKTKPPPLPRILDNATAMDEYAEEVTFTTSVRATALTAEELFDDDAVTRADVPRPDSSPVTTPLVDTGRTALANGRWRDACEAFAAALRVDPKDRVVRALYHVASGYEMREKGEGARALLQFETALAHNRDCEEAKRAIAQSTAPGPGKGKRTV